MVVRTVTSQQECPWFECTGELGRFCVECPSFIRDSGSIPQSKSMLGDSKSAVDVSEPFLSIRVVTSVYTASRPVTAVTDLFCSLKASIRWGFT